MERVIIEHQKSDMGHGWGHYTGATGLTLKQVLDELHSTLKSWGMITIYKGSDDIVRCFDFDLYNNKIFYHNLSGWQYNYSVRKVEFKYCFMSEDIDIYVS